VGIWAWEERFAELRQAMWSAYGQVRNIALPDWASLHLFCHRGRNSKSDWML